MRKKLPVLMCREVPPRRRGSVASWECWCPFCACYHVHGDGPGHRVAHCNDPASPFRNTGYVLKKERVAR